MMGEIGFVTESRAFPSDRAAWVEATRPRRVTGSLPLTFFAREKDK